MKTLESKVILVTGASRGIGAAVALKMADAGAKVIINYAGGQDAAEQTVNQIKQQGGDAIALQADVSKADEVKAMFDAAIAHYGRIDVLVNNAGVMTLKPLKDSTDEDFSRQFDINVRGTFNTLREAATRLADNGSIINSSTTQTRASFPGYGIYAATKAAVDQFTRIFAKEVGGRGINVNSIQPGPIATALFLDGKSEEVIARLAAANPFNRLGTPDDVARVVTFLASDDAKWISGQNIALNGGMA
ncbi:SDR family oxidoreductase [Mucilaginibacter sp. McL0603]|uniref:SDR family oxidoreductase n=1 Tax=Mucilaginibacter sp. McL0603 TaxID=3415670 RepID=UPI003CF34E2B